MMADGAEMLVSSAFFNREKWALAARQQQSIQLFVVKTRAMF